MQPTTFALDAPPRRLRLLIVAFFGLGGIAIGARSPSQDAGSPQEKDPIEVAQEATQKARLALYDSQRDLESIYRELETEFAILRQAGGEAFRSDVKRVVERVSLELQDRFDSLHKELMEEKGRPPRRGEIAHAFRPLIEGKFQSDPVTVEALQVCLVQALAQELATAAMDSEKEFLDMVDRAISNSLNPRRRFHEVWNDVIYLVNPIAQRYAESYNAYATAGAELQKLRRPARYLPGGNKVRPGMVYVDGGTYEVGPNKGFPLNKNKVTLAPFLMDRYEVTNIAYQIFFESLDPDEQRKRLPSHWSLDENGKARFDLNLADHPVVGITWQDAADYAAFAGKRLPTEWEWEVAASGPDRFLYPWGQKFDEKRCNFEGLGLETTTKVGQFPQGISPFGCLDMAGNVAEWTASDPEGRSLRRIRSSLESAVIRGGHFGRGPNFLRTRFRWIAGALTPRIKYIGFRCAADVR